MTVKGIEEAEVSLGDTGHFGALEKKTSHALRTAWASFGVAAGAGVLATLGEPVVGAILMVAAAGVGTRAAYIKLRK